MKKKIYKYDFLVVGAGLIGSLAALQLIKKNYSVLIIDKNKQLINDNRTLAVNANSRDFLIKLGLWSKLKSKPESIKKIIIKDNINDFPLVFENVDEEMGSVIYNNELLKESRKALKKRKFLLEEVSIPIENFISNKKISIKNKNYIFKNIVLCLGKKFNNENIINKFLFPTNHNSFVGFFDHSYSHNQAAYEIFTKDGPLAVLPSPNKSKKKSTFIYSTKKNISNLGLHNLLNNHFKKTHGKISLNNGTKKFELLPHLSLEKSNKYILIGDSLRSIHPVAGQGWNLGIKDIQTLTDILDIYDLGDINFIKKYYQHRKIESFTYLSFTSILNIFYENQNPISNVFIKTGFSILKNFDFLRNTFIKQAMGRTKLI